MSNEFEPEGTGHPNFFIERDYALRDGTWALRVETRVPLTDDQADTLKKHFKAKKHPEIAKLLKPLLAGNDDGKKRARRMVIVSLGEKDPDPNP